MRLAIGMMALVAIVFIFITSPESQPQATDVNSPVPEGSSWEHFVSAPETAQPVAVEEEAPPGVESDPEIDAMLRQVEAVDRKLDEQEARIAKLEAAQELVKASLDAKTSSSYPAATGTASYGSTGTKSLGSTGSSVTSYGSTGSAITPIVSRAPVMSRVFSGRWLNYDGLSPRDHAVQVHGFDPSLSDTQLAAMHDAYHDKYGGDAPMATATRSVALPRLLAPVPAVRSRSTTVSTGYVDCPGGVCPVQTSRTTTVQSRGGLLGFGILGRR